MYYQSKQKKRLICLDRVIISLFLFLTLIQPVYSQTQLEPKKSKAIRHELEKIVNDGKAPGMIGAIISSKGIVAIGSAGVRKAGTDIAFTTNDFVHLGSCTKAMTSTMIATLVSEGKLLWDMKLIDTIPELKKSIHSDYHGITLWQLLTHRAGIPKNPADWGAHMQKKIKARRIAILVDNLQRPATYKYEEFNYSNFGYMIAACMAEKVTGLSWEILMRKRLFDPLGMSLAGFGAPGRANKIDQPWGHEKLGNLWNPSYPDNPETLGPAGRIHCSIKDWTKFLKIYLIGKTPILKKKYLTKLITPIGHYAAGWGIVKQTWAKGIVLTHNGSNGIWYTMVMVAPNLERAFVVVTNSRDFSNTNDICTKMISNLIKMELNIRKK